ncbi:ferredoxin-nitrite reductase [Haladaptatus paucihalophilus DX253]|uniref:Ferredoxin-nitrite reductase n=1 Tax=Haladaptatus paucihalophilus DX253 TaxID=797209 RepID=E7QWL6_HALPU|nr:ferredoxin--nitrite reductase [Haladaptatus paucihalophilus]EFW91112.1 ferredoxin-nitrite reductase [Haladaptatus paucihalophilus DX253]SHL36926.1 ferredoxin-nitrite reductase [Haladaptatus paucihalophilus DX253]
MVHKKEKWKREKYGDDIRAKILEFAENGWETIPEDEREAWFCRFKFWGVFHQRTGQESYFMMRLTNCGGILEPGQLRAIGEVARDYATGPAENPEFGNGFVDFTTRQSIQLHWINLEDVPEIWDKLESVGVSTRSAGGDTMRNISGCPVAGKDKHEYVETRGLLDRIQAQLRDDDVLCNMPRKFNISVTGCREGCAQDSINDVALEPARKLVDGTQVKGFNMRAGGGLGGREPRRARSLDIFVTPDDAYQIVRAFVELYHEEGNRQNRRKNRGRFFVDDWGTDAIREELAERVEFPLLHAGTDLRAQYTFNAGRPDERGKHDHVGIHEQADGDYYVGLNVPVGRVTADEAIELADLADEYGSGELRLTRRQNPIIIDVDGARLDDLLAEPLLETHAPEPSPFTQGAMACTGTEFCSLALTETKVRATMMLRWLRDNVDLPDDISQLKIHFSGCTADCGQAMTADIGLQGMRARKNDQMVEAMDVGVGGGIGDGPAFIEWVHQRVPADEVPGLIKNLVEAFAALREEGQTFREWVDATGHESIIELAVAEETSYEDPCLHDAKQSWYPFSTGDGPAPTAPDGTPITSND